MKIRDLMLETMSENINLFGRMVSELWAYVRSKLFCVLRIRGPSQPHISRVLFITMKKLQEHDVS